MPWLTRLLTPLSLWAILFSLIYGLHGVGCASGWPNVATPFGSLHVVAMVAVWLGGLAGHIAMLRGSPRGAAPADRLLRLGAWIGLCASFLTLWPILLLTSCAAPA